jgi:hypothetical protein
MNFPPIQQFIHFHCPVNFTIPFQFRPKLFILYFIWDDNGKNICPWVSRRKGFEFEFQMRGPTETMEYMGEKLCGANESPPGAIELAIYLNIHIHITPNFLCSQVLSFILPTFPSPFHRNPKSHCAHCKLGHGFLPHSFIISCFAKNFVYSKICDKFSSLFLCQIFCHILWRW